MPLACIDLVRCKPAGYRRVIGEVDALTTVLKVPKDDRFPVITGTSLTMSSSIRTLSASEAVGLLERIVIQITLDPGRGVEQKRIFYKAIAEGPRPLGAAPRGRVHQSRRSRERKPALRS